jgi:probable F420-dependent oxidoreductase
VSQRGLAAKGVAMGPYAVTSSEFDRLPLARWRELAGELEATGFGALWLPEVLGREAFTTAHVTLASTERIVVASGVARALERVPKSAAAAQRSLWEAYPGRYLLGLGVSPASRERGQGPLPFLRDYLAEMDRTDLGFPGGEARPPRVIGAYSEGLMRLAGTHADGLLTVLVPPRHTALARSLLGPEPFLAVSQWVSLETDRSAAHAAARQALDYYLGLPHQLRKFRALGFDDADLARPGSDRLLESVLAWGSIGAVRDRLEAHLEAGADQVVLGAIAPSVRERLDVLRTLAGALLDFERVGGKP